PFVDYQASLRAIAEALIEAGMIPKTDLPPPAEDGSNHDLWAVLAGAGGSGSVQFIATAFMPESLEPLFRHKIPAWSRFGRRSVKRGVLFSVSRRDHMDLGRFYADIFSKLMDGVPLRRIPQIFVHEKAIVINAETARIIELELPPGLLRVADTVFHAIEGRP
ncbi:MAG: hypothetical protein MI741_13160, partial [Rhodospirillales bacterium]|nr:hypothetical protein [Rhodospirillales bacterium]